MIAKMVSDGGGNDDGHKKVRVDIRTRVELPAPEDEDEMSNTTPPTYASPCVAKTTGRQWPANRLPLKLFRPDISKFSNARAGVRSSAESTTRRFESNGRPGDIRVDVRFYKAECQLFIQSALGVRTR